MRRTIELAMPKPSVKAIRRPWIPPLPLSTATGPISSDRRLRLLVDSQSSIESRVWRSPLSRKARSLLPLVGSNATGPMWMRFRPALWTKMFGCSSLSLRDGFP